MRQEGGETHEGADDHVDCCALGYPVFEWDGRDTRDARTLPLSHRAACDSIYWRY